MDANPSVSATQRPDRPVFVLGERPAAIELVRALGETATLCAIPANRLLPELVAAVERGGRATDPLVTLGRDDDSLAARWYGDVQAGWLQLSGKARTVEFSALSVLRLCELFPTAQFVVVRQLKRAIPRSHRWPALGGTRILDIDSGRVTAAETLERVLAFLGEEAGSVVVDLSDDRRPGEEVAVHSRLFEER